MHQKQYTLEFKKKIVDEYLNDNDASLADLANRYKIPKSCIGEWIHKKPLLDNAKKSRNSFRLYKGGRMSNSIEI